jgi:hypothetical protein
LRARERYLEREKSECGVRSVKLGFGKKEVNGNVTAMFELI